MILSLMFILGFSVVYILCVSAQVKGSKIRGEHEKAGKGRSVARFRVLVVLVL